MLSSCPVCGTYFVTGSLTPFTHFTHLWQTPVSSVSSGFGGGFVVLFILKCIYSVFSACFISRSIMLPVLSQVAGFPSV